MGQQILITGGAGFIGSHLADRLVQSGYQVRVLDSLTPQVHGNGQKRPSYLHPDVELNVGDVRNRTDVAGALEGIDAIFHFAAAVGVGQSMYEVAEYTGVNDYGTALLLEEVIKRPVRRLIVASSMSIYGEGLYRSANGQMHEAVERTPDQLRRGAWEMPATNGTALSPAPTPEEKRPSLSSVYALSKYSQERMALMMGRAYDLEAVALRFFNVYGPRQALSNPYTGVLAIFASRYLNDKPPLIFEDGLQRRDFVHVSDVAQACHKALESSSAPGSVINVGSGTAVTIREVAERLARVMGKEYIAPHITGRYRMGDIRHCFADITKARNRLGYAPQVSLEEGLAELAEWLEDQASVDRVETASMELAERGLTL